MLKYSLLFIILLAVSFVQAQQFVIQSHEKTAKDSYILIGRIQNSEGKTEMKFSIKTQKGDFIAPDSTGKFVFAMKKQTKLLAIKDNFSQEVHYVLIDKWKVYPLKTTPAYYEGSAIIQKPNGRWIFIDENDQEPESLIEYEKARLFSDGSAIVKIMGKYYDIKNGLEKSKPPTIIFSEGIGIKELPNGKVCYIEEKDFNPINDKEYDKGSYSFREGIALVRQDKKYFFIDKEGRELTNIGEFNVMKITNKGYEGQQEGKAICFDKQGKVVTNCIY